MTLSAASPLQNHWLLFLLGGGALLFLFWVRRKTPPRPAARRTPPPIPAAPGGGREICETISELLGQLEECAGRINAQVEAHYTRLERIVGDADGRIARLEAVLQQADALRTRWAARTPSPPLGPVPGKEQLVPDTTVEEIKAVPSPINIADSTNDVPVPAKTPMDTVPRAATAAPDERFQRVYQQADAGRPPTAIAENLGLPLGEVELILNLRAFQ